MCNKYLAILLSITSLGLFSLLQAEESSSSYEKPSLKKSASGVEIRANFLASSGRFVQNFTETDPSGHEIQYSDTSDLTTKGFSLLIGYGQDYKYRNQSSFLYIGYENQNWSDEYDSFYHGAIIGAEGAIGSRTLKLFYGGEFASGALDTGEEGLGYLYTFSAEPFIGLRVLPADGISINFRVGVRGVYIEDVESMKDGNTLTSGNSAYTANALIGLGYSFY